MLLFFDGVKREHPPLLFDGAMSSRVAPRDHGCPGASAQRIASAENPAASPAATSAALSENVDAATTPVPGAANATLMLARYVPSATRVARPARYFNRFLTLSFRSA